MNILFWPDGCWVYAEEITDMTHRALDFGSLEVDDDTDEHTIDILVREQLG